MNFKCSCKKYKFNNSNYGYWEDRGITTDEAEILKILVNDKKINEKNILHVGIGNSELAKKLYKNNKIYGVTISKKEIDHANKLKLSNYKVFLCDKYTQDFEVICKKYQFDFVIDTNLKSYSCCQKAFEFMMYNIFNSLNSKGKLITSRKGMNWYKLLKPKLSFNFKKFFYLKLKETEGNPQNQLSLNELKKLSYENNIKISFDDNICYLEK